MSSASTAENTAMSAHLEHSSDRSLSAVLAYHGWDQLLKASAECKDLEAGMLRGHRNAWLGVAADTVVVVVE